jgi:hypothetical protein
MTTRSSLQSLAGSRGQSILEFALALPLIVLVVLGVIEFSFALVDKHVVTKLTREGSNLISRNTSLGDAATALKGMATRPVNFDDGTSKLIFSVLKSVDNTSGSNYGKVVLYARHELGTTTGNPASSLKTAGNPGKPPGPEYTTTNPDNNTSLQITNLPAGMTLAPGGMLYVTEVYSKHDPITPFDKFGVPLPKLLYSIAFF